MLFSQYIYVYICSKIKRMYKQYNIYNMKGLKYRIEKEGGMYRIYALKDFADVKAGDKGGLIESEANLSQDGNCWVYDNAKVFGNARIYDNARVFKDANIFGNAKIYGNAQVYDNALVDYYAEIYERAKVYGEAVISDNAQVYGDAKVYDNARVHSNALIHGSAELCHDANVYGSAEVFGYAQVFGHARVYGHAQVYGHARVYGHAQVCGNAEIVGASVFGEADIRGAIVKSNEDYIVFKNTWSSGRYFTYTRQDKMWSVGCFYGTGEELIEKAYKDSIKSGKYYEKYVKFAKSLECVLAPETDN